MTASRMAKHAEYLVAGRVVVDRVDRDRVEARVRGDGAEYRTGWTRSGGWSCTCPARSRCAHLRAVGLVVAVDICANAGGSAALPGARSRQ